MHSLPSGLLFQSYCHPPGLGDVTHELLHPLDKTSSSQGSLCSVLGSVQTPEDTLRTSSSHSIILLSSHSPRNCPHTLPGCLSPSCPGHHALPSPWYEHTGPGQVLLLDHGYRRAGNVYSLLQCHPLKRASCFLSFKCCFCP